MSRFLSGMIAGALLLFVAMHYHVVQSSEGYHLVPKISNNLSDIYVDVRQFGLDDWQQHKPLAAALVQNDQGHLIGDASANVFRDSVEQLVDGLFSRR